MPYDSKSFKLLSFVCLGLGYILESVSWGHEKVLFHKLIAVDGSTESCWLTAFMPSVTLKIGNLSQAYLLLKIPVGFPLFLSSPVFALWVLGLCCLRHIPFRTFVFLVGWSFYHLMSHPILPKCLSLCFTLWAVWYLHIDCLLHGVSSSIHLLHLSYKWVWSEFVTNRIYLGDILIDYARLCDSTDVFRASVDALKMGGIEVIYYLSPPPFLWFCLFYFFMWLEYIKELSSLVYSLFYDQNML